ncbi:MAG: hypothetical protein J0I12_07030 [Candidatus Eremiobacteraeota bacterium]|nr:hypothetical protein [Candidatus Eremiobacteraeota bacterium]
MASSIGIGNIGGAGEYKRNTPVTKKEADSNPQVGNDGFVSSGSSLPSQEQVVEGRLQQQTPADAPLAPVRAEVSGNRSPITLSMEEGIGAIGLSSGIETVGLSAFTNGIGKNNITTISGKVLAGNPYGN